MGWRRARHGRHVGIGGGPEEDFFQARIARLPGKLPDHVGQRAVGDLAAIFQDQKARANLLNQVEQMRADDDGCAVPARFRMVSFIRRMP